MKHHGQYDLLTPEELGLNAAYYDVEPKVREFIHNQLKRHKVKHRNDKRHKKKQKSRRGYGKQ